MLLLTCSLIASVLYHAQMPVTRRFVAFVVNNLVSGEIKGRLHISKIETLGLHKVVTKNISLYDAANRKVAFADEVTLQPDILGAFRGVIRFAHVYLKNAEVTLIESPSGLPTLITAFESKDPTPGIGPPLHAIVDDIHLGNVNVKGDILGLTGIRIEHFKARWRLEAQRDVGLIVYGATGTLIEPFPFHAKLQSLVGTISSNSITGIRLKARAGIRDETYTASIAYIQPEQTRDNELDVLVRTSKTSPQTLQGLGFEWARLIATHAGGMIRLKGPVDNLAVNGMFHTQGGDVALEGNLQSENTKISFTTNHVELDKTLLQAPEVTTSGSATIVLAKSSPQFILDLNPTAFNGIVFPAFKMRGRILDNEVAIDHLSSNHLKGTIFAKGHAYFNGRVRLNLEANIPDIKKDPNIPPGLSTGLQVSATIDTRNPITKDLEVRGRAQLRNFHYQNTRAAELAIEGKFRGKTRQPDIDIRASGKDIAVSGYPLTRLELNLKGGPSQYTAHGTATSGPNRHVGFDATVYASAQSYLVQANSIVASAGSETWRGSIHGLVYTPEHSISVERIILANGSQRLEAGGVYRFHDTDEFEANLQDFDLSGLQLLLGQDNAHRIEGRLDMHAIMRGQVTDPDILIEGAIREGHMDRLHPVEAVYVVQYTDSTLEFDAQATIEERSIISINGTGDLMLNMEHPFETFKRGRYEVSASVDNLPLSTLRQVSESSMANADGTLYGQINGYGTLSNFALDGNAQLAELSIGKLTGLKAQSKFNYGDHAFLATVDLSDSIGKLIHAEGAFYVDPIALAERPSEFLTTLYDRPWQIGAHVIPRSLEQLPEVISQHLPYPALMNAEIVLHGNATETRGRLKASVSSESDASANRKAARLRMTAKLDDGRVYASFNGFVNKEPTLKAEAFAPLDLHAWLRNPSLASIPPVTFEGHVWRMPLENIPLMPPNSTGPVDLNWDIKNLFTDHPTFNVTLHSHALRFFKTDPIAIDVTAKSNSAGLSFSGNTSDMSGGRSQLKGFVPVQWLDKAPFVQLDTDAPISLRTHFKRARLQPIFSAIPSIENADAIAMGTLNLTGTLNNIQMHGAVDIEQGHAQVIGLGQQLVNIHGKVIFNGKWAQLVGLRAEDGRGRTRINGGISFTGIQPSHVRLSLNSWKFPVRREGSVLATLSGNAKFNAAIKDDRMDATIQVSELSVALPDDTTSGVQELQHHPDLIIDGVAANNQEEGNEEFTVHIKVDARQPFWVRRSDFSVQIASELDMTYEKSALYIEGYAKLRRGFFDLFGKNFTLRNGTINFDGSSELNPEVNIQAVHELSTQSGISVTMTVDGRLSTPTVEFTSTHPDCQERSQVIDLLISGRCSGNDRSGNVYAAEEQTASFLAGITAGILTLGARREFGDLLPVISIETGQGGFASTRARLGYQADAFIPDFIKPYVLGAYVEGAFPLTSSDEQTQQQQQQQQYQQQGAGTRFLLELQFPHNFVGTSQYWPPGTWGFDLTWEP